MGRSAAGEPPAPKKVAAVEGITEYQFDNGRRDKAGVCETGIHRKCSLQQERFTLSKLAIAGASKGLRVPRLSGSLAM